MANGQQDEAAIAQQFANKSEAEIAAQFVDGGSPQPKRTGQPPQTIIGRLGDALFGPPRPGSLVDMARGGAPPSLKDFIPTWEDVRGAFANLGRPESLAAGAALGGFPRTPLSGLRVPAPAPLGGEGLPESVKPQPLAVPERDATRLNEPFAGDEYPGAPRERDATRLNVPGAGEEYSGMAPAERWRDATRLNVPYAGEDVGSSAIRTTPFSTRPPGSFVLPSTVPERSSVPGAAGEAWSMQRRVSPELQSAVRAGDPGAISTARRLDPTYNPIIIPREAGGAGTSPSQLESIRASSGLFGVETPAEAATASPTPTSASRTGLPAGAPTPFKPFQGLRAEIQPMATPSKAAGVPEWVAGQKDFEIQRLKGILRNPNATAEERAIAQSQLDFHMGNQ